MRVHAGEGVLDACATLTAGFEQRPPRRRRQISALQRRGDPFEVEIGEGDVEPFDEGPILIGRPATKLVLHGLGDAQNKR